MKIFNEPAIILNKKLKRKLNDQRFLEGKLIKKMNMTFLVLFQRNIQRNAQSVNLFYYFSTHFGFDELQKSKVKAFTFTLDYMLPWLTKKCLSYNFIL